MRARSPRLYDLLLGPAPSNGDLAAEAAFARLADLQEMLGTAPGTPLMSPIPHFSTIVEAGCALAAFDGGSCAAEDLDVLERLAASVPEEVHRALLDVLSEFYGFRAATWAAFQDAPTATMHLDGRFAPILGHQAALGRATLRLENALAAQPSAAGAAPCATPPAYVPGTLWIDLSTCNNHHTADKTIQLLIDAGGHDTYSGFTGGSNHREGEARGLNKDCHWTLGFAGALIDLAGSDSYVPTTNRNGVPHATGCGTNGGAHEGAGFLWDADGGDVYAAGPWGSNGGGNLGVGFLLDRGAGHDVYQTFWHPVSNPDAPDDPDPRSNGAAEASGSNGGGAAAGIGLLIDAGGSDSYTSIRHGANGGGDRGIGFLLDLGGDDSYIAGAFGTNGGGDGPSGAGHLWDMAGSDNYVIDDRSVSRPDGGNGAARQGTGALFDASGNDVYGYSDRTNRRGINGAGSVLGQGLLVDLAGDDSYAGDDTQSNGAGFEEGRGLLVDAAGYDAFDVGSHRSCQNDWSPVSTTTCSQLPKGENGALIDLPTADPTDAVWEEVPALHGEDFEDGYPNDGFHAPPAGWSLSGLWHATGCRAYRSETSLAFNQPLLDYKECPAAISPDALTSQSFRERASTVSPSWTLPGDQPTVLRWKSWHSTREPNQEGEPQDLMRVLVSAGSGDFQEIYIETGAQKTWNHVQVPLHAYMGTTIRVAFEFDSLTAASPHEGWYIDDVEVVAATVGNDAAARQPGSRLPDADHGRVGLSVAARSTVNPTGQAAVPSLRGESTADAEASGISSVHSGLGRVLTVVPPSVGPASHSDNVRGRTTSSESFAYEESQQSSKRTRPCRMNSQGDALECLTTIITVLTLSCLVAGFVVVFTPGIFHACLVILTVSAWVPEGM